MGRPQHGGEPTGGEERGEKGEPSPMPSPPAVRIRKALCCQWSPDEGTFAGLVIPQDGKVRLCWTAK